MQRASSWRRCAPAGRSRRALEVDRGKKAHATRTRARTGECADARASGRRLHARILARARIRARTHASQAARAP
eukprot:5442982-Pleurochrysis_carterae.AAC.1